MVYFLVESAVFGALESIFSWLNPTFPITCWLWKFVILLQAAPTFFFSYGKSNVDKTKILAGYWKILMFAKNLEFNFAAFLDNANSILVAKIHIFLLRFFFPDEFPILMKSSRDAKVQIFAAGIPIELLLESEFGWWNFNYVQFVGEILIWNPY